MGYYLHLVKQYMRHTKARTLYSVLGIMLTYILSFSILTIGYSAWDYQFYSVYSSEPYELFTQGERYTGELVKNTRLLEQDPAVDAICIYLSDPDMPSGRRMVLSSQLEEDKVYQLYVRLKTMKDLRSQAAMLNERYGLALYVWGYIEHYLREDESLETALLNFLLTFAATVFGLFSVVILRNTMMIAVTERSRDFGLLRCIGMSERQHRILLLTEGVLMSLAASVLGLGIGFELLKLSEPWLIKTLDLGKEFAFHFYPKAALYTTVICIGVTLFSLVEPARLSAQVSPLEAIRGVLAKELTLGKALKLLAWKLRGGKIAGKRRKSLSERLFGAPGFYAKRNLIRNGGSRTAVFIAVFLSVALMLTILSFVDSYKASLRRNIGDLKTDYREVVYLPGHPECELYDGEMLDRLKEFLMKQDKVTDCFSVILQQHYSLSSISMSPYFYSEKLKELSRNGKGPVAWILEMGLNREDMEKELPFLTEGNPDYDEMVRDNGVLLCDISTSDEEQVRKTDYHPGDTIEILSVDGSLKAREIFYDAIARASEKLGMPAWEDYEKSTLVWFENGKKIERKREEADKDTKSLLAYQRMYAKDPADYDRMEEAVLEALEEAGYDCRDLKPEGNYRIGGLMECVRQLVFDRGEREKIKICGILSGEVFTGNTYEAGSVSAGSGSMSCSDYMRILYPAESINKRIGYYAEKTDTPLGKNGYRFGAENDYRMSYRCQVGVKREMDILDDRLMNYVQDNGLQYENLSGSDYFAKAKKLGVVKISGITLGVFILLVCLLQLINTLQADMRIRKRELRLYEVAGMGPAQKLKMMLLEHGFGTVAAAFSGAAVSFLLSLLVFEKWINNEARPDAYVFTWPLPAAFFIVFGLLTTVAVFNLHEWRAGGHRGL